MLENIILQNCYKISSVSYDKVVVIIDLVKHDGKYNKPVNNTLHNQTLNRDIYDNCSFRYKAGKFRRKWFG